MQFRKIPGGEEGVVREGKASRQLRLSQLDKELDSKDMNMGTYKGMKDWLLYYHTHFPAQTDVTSLDPSI